MNKTIITLILILAVIVFVLVWILNSAKPTPIPSLETQEQKITSETESDVVQQINEGTSVNDIEQDLNVLSEEEEKTINNIEGEVNKMEQELSTQGL